jgi:hypothetical protein
MDDFRVGSISQYEPYREDQPAGRGNKEKRQKDPPEQEDAFESVVEQAEAETGAEAQDYYTPSEPAGE